MVLAQFCHNLLLVQPRIVNLQHLFSVGRHVQLKKVVVSMLLFMREKNAGLEAWTIRLLQYGPLPNLIHSQSILNKVRIKEFCKRPVEEGSSRFLPIFTSLIDSNEYSACCWTFLTLLFFLSNPLLWNCFDFVAKMSFCCFVQKSDKLQTHVLSLVQLQVIFDKLIKKEVKRLQY